MDGKANVSALVRVLGGVVFVEDAAKDFRSRRIDHLMAGHEMDVFHLDIGNDPMLLIFFGEEFVLAVSEAQLFLHAENIRELEIFALVEIATRISNS